MLPEPDGTDWDRFCIDVEGVDAVCCFMFSFEPEDVSIAVGDPVRLLHLELLIEEE